MAPLLGEDIVPNLQYKVSGCLAMARNYSQPRYKMREIENNLLPFFAIAANQRRYSDF